MAARFDQKATRIGAPNYNDYNGQYTIYNVRNTREEEVKWDGDGLSYFVYLRNHGDEGKDG